MSDRVQVQGFHYDDGHLAAWVALPHGPGASFRWCPGQSEALDKAAEAFAQQIVQAVELTIIENVPTVPDRVPEGVIVPCRMCGRQDPAGVTDGRGWTWCTEHREYARDG